MSIELASGDNVLPGSCGSTSRVGVKGFAYNFRRIQNQNQVVLLVIMFSYNSSKAPAPHSSSYLVKVDGQSLCFLVLLRQTGRTHHP